MNLEKTIDTSDRQGLDDLRLKIAEPQLTAIALDEILQLQHIANGNTVQVRDSSKVDDQQFGTLDLHRINQLAKDRITILSVDVEFGEPTDEGTVNSVQVLMLKLHFYSLDVSGPDYEIVRRARSRETLETWLRNKHRLVGSAAIWTASV